ncbi:LuxR C-terminal-related transcriptional regulator, partial [Klebsiella pneumoniae]|uniref:LuxR C-terminal-related transcriptional regulator n=2 Tax=Klebsiella pneumoniae TaxID=573 RepID=UPI0034D76DCF|nr:LuxR C-terminal-related transcriptional regulator [Klebsiella pneumoniae]
KSAQIREILISESAWEEMTCLFAPSPVENSPLTERECEILNELRCGATNLDIARALFISENTVRTHLYNVFRKLSVKNRTQAVSWANEHLRH